MLWNRFHRQEQIDHSKWRIWKVFYWKVKVFVIHIISQRFLYVGLTYRSGDDELSENFDEKDVREAVAFKDLLDTIEDSEQQNDSDEVSF